MAEEYIATILIRGLVKVNKDIKDTLKMLRLNKKHTCMITISTPVLMGMLQKVKDYVTYGIISKEDIEELKTLRKPISEDKKIIFSLAPPKGGFERGGIKKTFKQGGVLGKRENIILLLKKMV